jgi:hypothetical protein
MIKLKELIKESKKKDYGFKSDVGKFRQEYATHQGKFKQKALGLRETQQIMDAVGMVNEKIMKMIGELNELPVSDALDNVKKGSANKYIRAIETLKGICEHNTEWLDENS